MGKVSLGCGLLAVLGGQRKAGLRILQFVLAGHFLVAAYLAAMDSGAQTAAMALISLGLGVAVLHSCFRDPADWQLIPEDSAQRVAAGAVYLLAFAWPFWPLPGGPIAHVAYSLMAPLPHQTLLVLLAMIAVEGTRAPRLLGGTAIAAAGLLAVLDATLAGRHSTIAIAAVAALAAASVFRDKFGWSPFVASTDPQERDATPADAPPPPSRFTRPAPPKAPAPQAPPAARKEPEPKGDSGKRKWNLK